jgi:hypothetical protein
MNGGDPIAAPLEIVVALLAVVVNVVVVADIEGGIGKHKVDRPFRQIVQTGNAVLMPHGP